jgi:hypothetical protein
LAKEPAPNGGRANIGYYGGTECAQPTTVQIISRLDVNRTPRARCKPSPGTPARTLRPYHAPGTKTLALSSDNGATWQTLASNPRGHGSGDRDGGSSRRDHVDSMPASLFGGSRPDPHRVGEPDLRGGRSAAPRLRCPRDVPATDKTCKAFDAICYEGLSRRAVAWRSRAHVSEVLQDLTILGAVHAWDSDVFVRSDGARRHVHSGDADQLGLDFHMGIWVDSTNTDATNYAAVDASVGIVCGAPNAPDGMGAPEESRCTRRSRRSSSEMSICCEFARRSGTPPCRGEKARFVHSSTRAARIPPSIEVVTAETYSDWLTASPALYEAVDRIIWHSHPWWEQIPIADAAAHFATTHDLIVANMAKLGINKPERCGETGWPWDIDNGAAVGSEANQAQYLHDLNAYSRCERARLLVLRGLRRSVESRRRRCRRKMGIMDVGPHGSAASRDRQPRDGDPGKR